MIRAVILFSIGIIAPSLFALFQQKAIPPAQFKTKIATSFSDLLKNPVEKPITLITTGDVMLGRDVNVKATRKNDFTYLWQNFSQMFETADMVLINLETPLTENCPLTSTGMIFCADPRHTHGLIKSGVNLASLANNHTLNYGQEGLEQTKKILEQAGIKPVDNKLVIKKINKTRFGFLAYNLLEKHDVNKISAEIKTGKSKADILVVSFHWGNEYTPEPSTSQKTIAHLTIDNGADLVIGNHPHWTQPIEEYKGKVIVYSHGNFIFDQMWSQKTREGIISKFTFVGNKLQSAEYTPITINTEYQPEKGNLGESKE